MFYSVSDLSKQRANSMRAKPTLSDYDLSDSDADLIQRLGNLELALDGAKRESRDEEIAPFQVGAFIGVGIGLVVGFLLLNIAAGLLVGAVGFCIGYLKVLSDTHSERSKIKRISREISAIQIDPSLHSVISAYRDDLQIWDEEWQRSKKRWTSMAGQEFEREFAKLLTKDGWEAEVTPGSGDGGVDIKAQDPNGDAFWFQCKRWNARCGVDPIRKMVGTLVIEGANATAVVLCTGGFTESAEATASKAGVVLWGIEEVMQLMQE